MRETLFQPSKPAPVSSGNKELDEAMEMFKQKYPNIPDVRLVPDEGEGNRGRAGKRRDPNLEFEDEADAYSKYKSQGYFTANPAGESLLSIVLTHYPTSFRHVVPLPCLGVGVVPVFNDAL